MGNGYLSLVPVSLARFTTLPVRFRDFRIPHPHTFAAVRAAPFQPKLNISNVFRILDTTV